MINILKRFICRRKGHLNTVLEVHVLQDIIRCSRCNKIKKVVYKG